MCWKIWKETRKMWQTVEVHVWQEWEICRWKYDLLRPRWSLCPRNYMWQRWRLYKYCIVQAIEFYLLKLKITIKNCVIPVYASSIILEYCFCVGTQLAIITSHNNKSVDIKAAGTTCVPCEDLQEGGCDGMSTSSYLSYNDTQPGLNYKHCWFHVRVYGIITRLVNIFYLNSLTKIWSTVTLLNKFESRAFFRHQKLFFCSRSFRRKQWWLYNTDLHRLGRDCRSCHYPGCVCLVTLDYNCWAC